MKLPISKRIQRHLPFFLLIILNLLIGILVVRDYGESVDEPGIYAYAEQSLRAYINLLRNGTLPHYLDVPFNAVNYGPAYAMFTVVLAQGLHAIIPVWSQIDGRHFGAFLAFQLSVVSLYFLARKWMGGWAAMGTALVFSTQPVLWGPAFINPKDIPFLAFFLASVTAGIYMVDALPAPLNPNAGRPRHGGSSLRLQEEWENLPSSLRKIMIAYGVIFLDSLLFMATGGLSRLVSDGVVILYQADKNSLLGSWFSRLARNSSHLPVGNYIHKAQIILLRGERISATGGFVVVLLVLLGAFPRYCAKLASQRVIPSLKRSLRLLTNPAVLAAGFVLGFTTSIRVAGPYAGVIVLLYAFYKSWRKALLLLLPYTLSALLICYLTWPYLWGDAVHRFITSVTLMSRYPFGGPDLFQGTLFRPSKLPAYYLPYTMSIQLTEVVPVLFFLGLVLSAWKFVQGHQREPFALTILWFVLPLMGIIFDKSTLYNNFRQELFLLPPLFITGGVALEVLFSRMKREWLKTLFLGVLILPGLYADVTLHPYQYIYYNSFVGGEAGAFRKFEFDYYGTSYREAARYVNQVAPPGAAVVITSGAYAIFAEYARPDLKMSVLSDLRPDIHYDFIVLDSNNNSDQTVCPSIRPVKTIAREGAILAVVKAPPVSVHGCP